MRHGLEVRVPFLDRSFIQFALSLPSSLLLSPTGVTKRVLRTHVARRVSPQIAAGKKRGFSVPIGEAMRGALGETLRQKLTAPSFAIDGPIDVDVALGVLTEHREGRADHGHALYALLVRQRTPRRGCRGCMNDDGTGASVCCTRRVKSPLPPTRRPVNG